MRFRSFALIFVGAASFTTALAQSYNTYPDWDGSYTSGWYAIGQQFTAPGGDLLSYEFGMYGGTGSFDFLIEEGTPGGTVLLDDSVTWDWEPTSSDYTWTGDVAMTAGDTYSVVIDLDGSNAPSEAFMFNDDANVPGGVASWYSGGWVPIGGLETEFNATFASSTPAPAAAIPALLGFVGMVRRRRNSR
jgi:hypothetical protein